MRVGGETMELTTRQINAYQKVISDFAFAPTTKEKDKAKLIDVLDLLDELLIAGAVYKK